MWLCVDKPTRVGDLWTASFTSLQHFCHALSTWERKGAARPGQGRSGNEACLPSNFQPPLISRHERAIGLRQGAPHETERNETKLEKQRPVVWLVRCVGSAPPYELSLEDAREACPATLFCVECISHPSLSPSLSLSLIVLVLEIGPVVTGLLIFHLRHREATSLAKSPVVKGARQGGGIADFEPVESACTKMHVLR
jgi:hypothetical protein